MRKIYRLKTVCDVTGNPRSTLYHRIDNGLFMPPVKLGKRSAGWPSDEVEAICAATIAGWSESKLRDLVAKLVENRKTAAKTWSNK